MAERIASYCFVRTLLSIYLYRICGKSHTIHAYIAHHVCPYTPHGCLPTPAALGLVVLVQQQIFIMNHCFSRSFLRCIYNGSTPNGAFNIVRTVCAQFLTALQSSLTCFTVRSSLIPRRTSSVPPVALYSTPRSCNYGDQWGLSDVVQYYA